MTGPDGPGPTPPVRVVVEADGGARGNPGPAGYGALVRDAGSGALLAERADGIGRASNNVAEYRGLIAGLAAALELGAREVEVRMDSRLVVEQMAGRWQVKHPDMRALAAEAAVLVRRFDRVDFRHIPRERNKHADRLANEAMDAQERGRRWQPRPLAEVEAARGELRPDAPEVPAPSAPPGAPLAGPRLVGFDGDPGAPVRLVLLRHGETQHSVDRRFSGGGGADLPLTERGRDQADRVGARLAARGGLDAIVCSPLLRARQSAAPVAAALDLPVVVEPALIETSWGDWDGLTAAEVRERWPVQYRAWLDDPAAAPPGGESITAVQHRVRSVRLRMLARFPGRSVLVVTHTTPIKLVVGEAVGAGLAGLYRIHLDLASLSVVDFHADGHPVVRGVNDTAHLDWPSAPPLA